MLSRDSCLQPGARNSFGISGNVFEDPPAPNERSLTGTLCEPVSLNIGRSVANGEESERNTQHFAIPTPRLARKFSTWNPPSHAEGAYPQNCMVAQPRNQVSEMHFDKCPDLFRHFSVGKRAGYVPVLTLPRKLC